MESYNMFFAGMLVMALGGGLIVVLFIRPWLRPMRRGWEASHEVVAENSRLATAKVRWQTAEEQDRAMQVAVTAEQARARLIEAQAENDQSEIERRTTFRQADTQEKVQTINDEVSIEKTRARLIEAQAENDQAEIERRTTFRQADTQEKIQAINDEVSIEKTRARLIEARAENDQLEIERRAALKRAGINPDAPKPKNWFARHRYLVVIMIMAGLIVAMAAIKPFVVNHYAPKAQSVKK